MMMELCLNRKNWKPFSFKEIFQITTTSSGIDKNKLNIKSGLFPYVTRSETNNGYDIFVDEQENEQTDTKNSITIGLDTQTVFYQPYPFYTGEKVQILKNSSINREVAIFLIPLIKRQMKKFNWGRGATLIRLKRSKIFLPVDWEGSPDYAFMEAYVRQKEQEKLKEYQTYIAKHLAKLGGGKKFIALKQKQWREFEIGKLFVLSQGKSKGLAHLQKDENGVNYLGATNINNGVLCQVTPHETMIHKGNSIAFIRNGEGSMGYSIYKSENFIATSDISVGYNNHLNRSIGTFITTIADKVRGKYNFGYKRSGGRLAKEKIMLPITQENIPDYVYMEAYMKQLEYKKLLEYQKYIESRVNLQKTE